MDEPDTPESSTLKQTGAINPVRSNVLINHTYALSGCLYGSSDRDSRLMDLFIACFWAFGLGELPAATHAELEQDPLGRNVPPRGETIYWQGLITEQFDFYSLLA